MTMGERIRFYRNKQGLTMEQLGEMLGVRRAAVMKYEDGSVENIKRSTIKRMAEIFGVSPCYLMWGEETETTVTQLPRGLTDSERQLLAAFRALNAQGQAMALATVEAYTHTDSLKQDTAPKVG